MLTKKKLRKWINLGALGFILATIVVGWVLSSMPNVEKVVATGALLVALRATLPGLTKEAGAAVDNSDLPEDETEKKS